MAAGVGAHFGRPGTKTVSVMGDGSFGFTAGELETIVRLKVPLMMVVISNSTYGWIKAGQKTGFGSATTRWISRAPTMPGSRKRLE